MSQKSLTSLILVFILAACIPSVPGPIPGPSAAALTAMPGFTSTMTPISAAATSNPEMITTVPVSDLDRPVVVTTLPLDGSPVTALSATEERLLVFSQNAESPEERQLHIFDIGNPIDPIEVGQLRPALEIVSFTVAGDIIYAAAREGERYLLYLLDIADPARPVEAGRFALPTAAGGLITSGDLLYMTMTDTTSNEIWALDISGRSHPYLAGHHPLPTGNFAVDGDQIYLAAGNAGLYILQVEK